MTLKYCNQCGRELSATDSGNAFVVTCPTCGQKNTEVPASPVSATPVPPLSKEKFLGMQITNLPGTELPVMTREAIEAGHPKVNREIAGNSVAYRIRSWGVFGWIWLTFISVHAYFMFRGFNQGTVYINHKLVAHPEISHYFYAICFYAIFFLVGFAMATGRWRILLEESRVSARWRCFPGAGWTWELPIGKEVRASLEYRGASTNHRPQRAVVVKSQGQEIYFGSFWDEDVKRFIAAAIHDYYGVGVDDLSEKTTD